MGTLSTLNKILMCLDDNSQSDTRSKKNNIRRHATLDGKSTVPNPMRESMPTMQYSMKIMLMGTSIHGRIMVSHQGVAVIFSAYILKWDVEALVEENQKEMRQEE